MDISIPQSMSAGDTTEDKELTRWGEHEKIIVETLKRIPMNQNEKENYIRQTAARYALKRFYTAIDYRDKNFWLNQYQLLEEENMVTKQIRQLYLRNRFLIWKIFFKLADAIKR